MVVINGKHVRELRGRNGWTQAELATRAHLNERTVKRIESSERCKSQPPTAAELARALGVPIPELLLEAETERKPRTEFADQLDELTVARHRAESHGDRSVVEACTAQIDELVHRLTVAPAVRRGEEMLGARLVRVVGSGNFADVWEAHSCSDPSLTVAIKIFRPAKLGQGLSLHFFRRGVRAMAHLNADREAPPSVIRLLQVNVERTAFSMDFMEKLDLSKVVGGWELATKLSAFKTICEAVAFAHARKVLHRDIKPENVLVDASGRPILADFDIADLLFVQTLTAPAAGTVLYAAPEQLVGDSRPRATADLYSLGRLLHFLLLGRNPPLSMEARPVLDDLASQPIGLVRIVRKCTMHSPDDRYQSVDHLLADLGRHGCAPEQVGTGSSVEPQPAAQSAERAPVGRRWRWRALAGGALVVVGAFAIAARPPPVRDESRPGEPAARLGPYSESPLAELRGRDLRNRDLRGATLKEADLRGAKLEGANLEGANLSGADLTHANLQGARLSGADLQDARLNDANLRAADLRGANLIGAGLLRADVSEAELLDAKAHGVSLRGVRGLTQEQVDGLSLGSEPKLPAGLVRSSRPRNADFAGSVLIARAFNRLELPRSDFRGSDLTGSRFARANVAGANFRDAFLIGTNFLGANLRSADLDGANLYFANLSEAVLTAASLDGTDLTGAILHGAQLTGAKLAAVRGLTQAQLDVACGEQVSLPAGYRIKPCSAATTEPAKTPIDVGAVFVFEDRSAWASFLFNLYRVMLTNRLGDSHRFRLRRQFLRDGTGTPARKKALEEVLLNLPARTYLFAFTDGARDFLDANFSNSFVILRSDDQGRQQARVGMRGPETITGGQSAVARSPFWDGMEDSRICLLHKLLPEAKTIGVITSEQATDRQAYGAMLDAEHARDKPLEIREFHSSRLSQRQANGVDALVGALALDRDITRVVQRHPNLPVLGLGPLGVIRGATAALYYDYNESASAAVDILHQHLVGGVPVEEISPHWLHKRLFVNERRFEQLGLSVPQTSDCGASGPPIKL